MADPFQDDSEEILPSSDVTDRQPAPAVPKEPAERIDPVDPDFYLSAYADVRAAGVNPSEHYRSHGQHEGRVPSRASLTEKANALSASGLFDPAVYERLGIDPPELRLTAIEHYILFGAAGRSPPNNWFDSEFYTRTYRDVAGSGINTLLHYAQIGQSEARFVDEIGFVEALDVVSAGIDPRYYAAQSGVQATGPACARHYLIEGVRSGLRPARDFEDAYYRRRYGDIEALPYPSYVHFLRYGRGEGRIGFPNLAGMIRPGRTRFDPNRETILIANHEASRTGAPLVGLELARTYARTCNIVTYLGRDRGIADEFAMVSCGISIGEFDALDLEYLIARLVAMYRVKCVLANSAETRPFVVAARLQNLPVVALVHEFSEYSLPGGKIADVLAAANIVVVPATLLKTSAEREAVKHFGVVPDHIVVRPQGYIAHPPVRGPNNDIDQDALLESIRERSGLTDPRIVFGAGYVQIRKGVDLFIQTAIETRARGYDDVCFVWVGEGYAPDADASYSVYLRELVERSGIGDRMFFYPAQNRLDAFFSVADCFLMSSRLDPYPNVVVDALQAAIPVVCFDQATGCAELFTSGTAVGAAVPYCDVRAASTALTRLIGDPITQSSAERNRAVVADLLDFDAYATFVNGLLRSAMERQADNIDAATRIAESDLFDPVFYSGGRAGRSGRDSLIADYVATTSKGLQRLSPMPGFNDGLYKASIDVPTDAPIVALADAIARNPGGPVPTTHRAWSLAALAPTRTAMTIGLHLHLHYPDTLPLFLERLERLGRPVDLIVTTTSAANVRRLDVGLENYDLGRVDLIECPNRGRDIGPFLIAVGDVVRDRGYDLVGHLHGKKSLSTSATMGTAWRTFLLDTLLGNPDEIDGILGLFERDPQLGLVFAEDRHAVGWNDNRDKAERFVRRLTPVPSLPDYPYFPLGNMFWARPAAIAPLWDSGLHWSDLPAEPIADDGTVLHAVERLLPVVCKSTGFGWSTVYKPGLGW